ncbi:MAG: pyridoxamine 5'-phosphate oxidase family protein [Pseudomonadota bacterium]
MDRYDDLMFTPAVRALQRADGSEETYARSYGARTRPLGADERVFIESRSSFYMASVSETGWPYIQHRGGPVGFLKMLGEDVIGFADYRGNRQHISEGNLSVDPRVSLFLMDYPRKARLKMQGEARVQSAEDAPALAEQLTTEGQGRIQRVVTITVRAFDWNCPQFITPRFTEEDIAAMLGAKLQEQEARIAQLEAELAALR